MKESSSKKCKKRNHQRKPNELKRNSVVRRSVVKIDPVGDTVPPIKRSARSKLERSGDTWIKLQILCR